MQPPLRALSTLLGTTALAGGEFVAADRAGNVYGAEVPGETLLKYQKIR